MVQVISAYSAFLGRLRTALGLFLAAPLLLSAQVTDSNARIVLSEHSTGKLSGIVTDALTKEPLVMATVKFPKAARAVFTDEFGRFAATDLPIGQHSVQVSYMGYEDQVMDNVQVGPSSASLLQLSLQPLQHNIAEHVVTASARSQAIKLAPASIGVITDKQLRERNVRTFDQAFDDMPGVVVTRSSGSNVQALSIRGASEVAGGGIGNRVLLLIDGRPSLSPESGGALWNLVPLGSIERIEVVRGAYSSLYGSAAMGGVINVITRKPSNTPQTQIYVDYGAYGPAPAAANYTKFGDFHSIALNHSRKLGRFSYLLDGNWRSDDGHREQSNFDLFNFYGKMACELSKNRHLLVSANANRIKNATPATWLNFRQAYSVADHKKDDFQDRGEYNTDLYYYATPNEKLKYSTRFYHYRNESRFSFDDDPGNDSTNVNIGKQIVERSSVSTYRIGNITQIDLFDLKGHYVIAGVDTKFDDVKGRPDTILYGHERAFSVGVYVQDEYSVGEKLTVTAGVRMDHYAILGETKERNFSPKLAAVYQGSAKFSTRLLLAQAFRDPPVAERFIKFEQGGGLRFQPNADLRPERLTLAAEWGAKFNPTPLAAFDVCVFYNRYKDLVSFQQLPTPNGELLYRVVNLNEALMQGFEVSYRQQWRKCLNFNVSYTFLDARDASPERLNNALAYKPRHVLGASANVMHKRFSLNINCRYRSKIEEVFIYPGSEPQSAFVTNAKLNFQCSKQANCFLAVNNANNAQYEELERYRMAGRSFSTGFSVQF